jgi:hypothetical protein
MNHLVFCSAVQISNIIYEITLISNILPVATSWHLMMRRMLFLIPVVLYLMYLPVG